MPTVENASNDLAVFAIIEEIATEFGVEPTELPPLQDAIDTYALASLIDNSDSDSVFVKFGYDDHVVTVDSTGHVEVEPAVSVER